MSEHSKKAQELIAEMHDLVNEYMDAYDLNDDIFHKDCHKECIFAFQHVNQFMESIYLALEEDNHA